jgi:hypothetical protein
MYEYEHQTDRPLGRDAVDRSRFDRVAQATMERVTEWSPDRTVDPGDSHDKGEASLCVGEAA